MAQGYAPNWSKKIPLISKIKKTVAWTYAISDLNDKEFDETFYENELQKIIQTTLQKVVKKFTL